MDFPSLRVLLFSFFGVAVCPATRSPRTAFFSKPLSDSFSFVFFKYRALINQHLFFFFSFWRVRVIGFGGGIFGFFLGFFLVS